MGVLLAAVLQLRLLVAVAWLAAAWTASPGVAQGQPMALPRTPAGVGFSPQSGLQVTVDFPRPSDLGYVTIRFTLARQKPATASQLITIRTQLLSSRYPYQTMDVERDFEMLGDRSRQEFLILCPCYSNWNRLGWTIWVDGRKDDAISTPTPPTLQPGTVEMTSILQSPRARRNGLLQFALDDSFGGGAQELIAPWQNWPTDWLAYTTIDLATIEANELVQLAAESPAVQQALLRWIRGGGNLWIVGLDDQWQQLDAVEQSLRLPDRRDQTEDLPTSHGWQVVSLDERARQAVESLLEISDIETAIDAAAENDAQTDDAMSPEAAPDSSRLGVDRRRDGRSYRLDASGDSYEIGQGGSSSDEVPELTSSNGQFYVRAFGLGTITVQAPQIDATQRSVYQFNQAFSDSLLTQRMNWAIRHGVDPGFPSQEFNNWLIPGVGVAPVGGFQLLLSLFVIAIGPLNYWLLRRAKKLPWLLVTVPAAAATVTLLLFAYGVLADGFGVQVRARSVTVLDQASGEGATWARLSYYAGLAPRDGLTFSDHVAIYPIRPNASAYDSRARGEQRELVWENGQQRLPRGWLFSRTPTQYLTVSVRPLSQRLHIDRSDAGLRATNQLGVDILALAVQDHAGNHYWLDALPAGETASLAATDFSSISRDLRERFSEHDPVYPVGGQPDGSSYNVTLDYNLLEGHLGAAVSPLARGLGDGHYVAITRRGIDLELGRVEVEENASFHVVKGRYVEPVESFEP